MDVCHEIMIHVVILVIGWC